MIFSIILAVEMERRQGGLSDVATPPLRTIAKAVAVRVQLLANG
ncbi:MAG: hypothetical protein RMM58_02850 [Chloroflexota bacterium]|nr:hypothetical protein [Dehalococcoidia bacterium]MDW8252796.1 hypothetical protein [Chloroflexota bacterium]